MAIRRNVANLSQAEKARYVSGCKLLKTNGRYNQFIQLHRDASPMSGPSGTSAAHMGPAFLPWHREFILRFERDLQGVLNDPNFGLPYWDWTDAVLSDPASPTSIWTPDFMGGNGDPVTGPFSPGQGWQTFDPDNPGTPGNLRRNINASPTSAPSLPTQADVNVLLAIAPYDSPPFNMSSGVPPNGPSFRSQLEGFAGAPPNQAGMHNRVHVWVGGQMNDVPRSPNDPVFFLHHCNVDRLWAIWQQCSATPGFMPVTGADAGHNLNDPMFPWVAGVGPGTIPTGLRDGRRTPADLENIIALGYSYENPRRQTITLRRTTGNRFVSDKIIQVANPCSQQAETDATLFVPGRAGGAIRARLSNLTDQVDVVP